MEETNACNETNDTPEKSFDTQLFGAGKPEGVALLGGHHTHLPQKNLFCPTPTYAFTARRRGALLKFLEMILFPQFPQNDEIYSKIIPQAFFNILKEPLLVQKQMIPHKKALILSFLELERLRAWHDQERATPPFCKKHILLIFYIRREGF